MATVDDHRASFSGLETLISPLDAAVAGRTPQQACQAVASLLPLLLASHRHRLPAVVFEPVHGHYARRLLYTSPVLGYSVVAMTWAPGQGTPIHDHDHQWCVDVVCQGRLDITPYRVIDRDDDGWSFAPLPVQTVHSGQCSALLPPEEYHRVHNPDPHEVAVSIHVYQGTVARYTAFDPDGERYLPRDVVIWLD